MPNSSVVSVGVPRGAKRRGPMGPAGAARMVSIAVPVLTKNSSVDRPITWAPAMPSANYLVQYAPDANGIGRTTFTVKAGTQTAAGCTITVTASLAVTLAGVCHVMACTS